jgi:hypothetical protein
LYVGGAFTHAGTTSADRIARWGGTSWSALGQGLNDTAAVMAQFDDGTGPMLVVGGLFTSAPDSGDSHLAAWGRSNCPVGTGFCFGTSGCPCGNNGSTGEGCASSLGVGGQLVAIGHPSITSDSIVLHGSQMPDSSVLYFQGTTMTNAPFGDGLRCVAGSVIRLGIEHNVGGISLYPETANAPVSVRGMIGAPGTREYQAWYRNAAAFCTSSSFNLSNGWEIVWTN